MGSLPSRQRSRRCGDVVADDRVGVDHDVVAEDCSRCRASRWRRSRSPRPSSCRRRPWRSDESCRSCDLLGSGSIGPWSPITVLQRALRGVKRKSPRGAVPRPSVRGACGRGRIRRRVSRVLSGLLGGWTPDQDVAVARTVSRVAVGEGDHFTRAVHALTRSITPDLACWLHVVGRRPSPCSDDREFMPLCGIEPRHVHVRRHLCRSGGFGGSTNTDVLDPLPGSPSRARPRRWAPCRAGAARRTGRAGAKLHSAFSSLRTLPRFTRWQ